MANQIGMDKVQAICALHEVGWSPGNWGSIGRRWRAISKHVAIQNRPKCPPGRVEWRDREKLIREAKE